jgi:hypothetical protein
VTDGNRRKLILLAEARQASTDATVVVQRLVAALEMLGGDSAVNAPFYVPTRVAKDFWSSLIDIRERLSQLIGEVPS